MEDNINSFPETLIGNRPTIQDVSKCGISQLIKVGGYRGYPLIMLNLTDKEYFPVLKSLLKRHRDRDPKTVQRQNEACEQWIRKVDQDTSRYTGEEHPALRVCKFVPWFVI